MKILPDGTYLSVINPGIRGTQRRAAIMATAREIADADSAATAGWIPTAWIPTRRIWSASWSTTCPTAPATAPGS